MERTKEDLKKAHERADQGLTADQGSAQEIILGDYLKEIFKDTNDQIFSYEKGEPGADWLQEVYEKNTSIGKILFESKKTKSFANKWIDKLQQDMSEAKADIGIIFTTSSEFNFVSIPSRAEESTPFTAISRFFPSKPGVFSGFCEIRYVMSSKMVLTFCVIVNESVWKDFRAAPIKLTVIIMKGYFW